MSAIAPTTRVRIDATALRARVVAEGGNLGLTQRARVEYALAGGYVNTDAIDNSAGVDTSDHEVNSKILLDGVVATGGLTVESRNDLLHAVTDDVAELVLHDNRAQNLALAIARSQAADMVDVHARYLRDLVHDGRLSLALEALPTDKQMAERQAAGIGLTTPEFAVLLSYTKMGHVEAILASDLVEDAYVQPALAAYFPAALSERFRDQLPKHPLRRQIIATVIVNEVVNRSGTTFELRMAEETGADTPDTIARPPRGARRVRPPPAMGCGRPHSTARCRPRCSWPCCWSCASMVERGVLWLLRHRRPPLDIGAAVAAFRPGVAALADALPDLIGSGFATTIATATKDAIEAGVPAELAAHAAGWPYLHTAFDLVEVARARGRTPADTALVYWGLFERLDLGWLWERIGALPRTDRWQSHARAALRDDLLGEMRTLADDALRAGDVFTLGAGPARPLGRHERAGGRRVSRRCSPRSARVACTT